MGPTRTTLRRPVLALAAATLALAAPGARAQIFIEDGAALSKDCGSPRAGPYPPACRAYVAGAADQILFQDNIAGSRWFCPPAHVTSDQLADVVARYMARHPDEGARPAAFVVRTALNQGLPC